MILLSLKELNMSKVFERPKDPRVEEAFNSAYNKKNRKFTFGGNVVTIPIPASEIDIKDLCLSLMPNGNKVKLLPKLSIIRQQLLEAVKPVEK